MKQDDPLALFLFLLVGEGLSGTGLVNVAPELNVFIELVGIANDA